MNPRLFPVGLTTSILLLATTLSITGCSPSPPSPTPTPIDRASRIPSDAVKMSPENDPTPPILYVDDYQPPIPLPGPVNTAGAEDGVFVTPDGESLFFFFTPDVTVPVEEQILDGVTGLYVSHLSNGAWGEPQRILLQDRGKLALDGCEFVQGEVMWFCTAREGYTGLHWFTAQYRDGAWTHWQEADFPPEYQVGELHIASDGRQLYFHSDRLGGKGGLDIWVSQWADGTWGEPANLAAVNTSDDEGWPALNPAGDELWITRNWGLWRSRRVNGGWGEPELVVSPLAGEASLDRDGNLYFVHHYYVDGEMVEADIYIAYKKK